MAKTLNEIFARLDDDKANRALETNRERQKKQEQAERERRERQAAESAVEKYHVYDEKYDVDDDEPIVMIPNQKPTAPPPQETTTEEEMDEIADSNPFVQNMFKRPHKKVKQEKQPQPQQQQAPRQNVSQPQQQSAASKVQKPSEQKPAPNPTATPAPAVQVPVAKPAAKPQPPVQKSAVQPAKAPTAPVSQNVRVPVKQNQPTQRQSAFAPKPPVAAHPTAQPPKTEQKPAPTPAPAQTPTKPTPPPQPKKAEVYDGFAMAMMQHKTAPKPKPKPNIPAAPTQTTAQPESEQTSPVQPAKPAVEPVHHKVAAPIIEKTVPEQPVENLEAPSNQEPIGEPVSVPEQQESSAPNAQWPVGMGGPQFAGTVKDAGETPRTIVAEEANVFFASCYDAAAKAAAYGLCIDTGSDAVLLTKRSTAPNEVEHVLNGAIEMFNALKEHGVHDVVIYTDARVAQYMSENASRLLNGRSEVCRRYIDMAWNTMTSVSVRFVTSPVKSEYAQLTASTVNCFIKPRV